MRIVLELEPEGGELALPVHYNHLVQGLIYRSLDEALAGWFHDRGYCCGKRRFKLFTFSRLFSQGRKYDPEKKTIIFPGPVRLKVGSVDVDLLESLVVHLIRRREVRLNGRLCHFTSVEVEMPVEATGPVVVRALSPIVVYSTLKNGAGGKKTYYYNPWEGEFQEKIFENLRRKWSAFHGSGEPPALEGAYIKPVKVSKRNEAIVLFKGTVIKGWTGLYELYLPEAYFSLAYDAGLGAKNPQGFGMVEVVKNTGEKSKVEGKFRG